MPVANMPMVDPKQNRHLPVLRGSRPDTVAPQSSWAYVLLGSIVIVTVWLPLAFVGLSLGRQIALFGPLQRRLATFPSTSVVSAMLTAGLVVLSFAVACALGGAVVGRFADHHRRWDATLTGILGSCIILFLAALGHALQPPAFGTAIALSLFTIAPPAAALGGRWGSSRRAKGGN